VPLSWDSLTRHAVRNPFSSAIRTVASGGGKAGRVESRPSWAGCPSRPCCAGWSATGGLQLVEVGQPPAAAQVPGVVDDGLDAKRSPLLEVLLHPAVPVEGVDGHVNTAGDDPGSEDVGRRRQEPPAEDQFDLVRPTHIQDRNVAQHLPGQPMPEPVMSVPGNYLSGLSI
jgi:hypothetical protein